MKRFLAILLALGMLAACGSPAAPPGLETGAAPPPESLTLQEERALKEAQVEEKLKELHKAALERGCPFRAVETREEYLALFPPAAFCEDETAQELSRFLYNAKLGTVVEDINFSEKAAFKKGRLRIPILLQCCVQNVTLFSWGSSPKGPTWLEGGQWLEEQIIFSRGWFKEDLDQQAKLYFGASEEVGNVHTNQVLRSYRGILFAPSLNYDDAFSDAFPLVLSYTETPTGWEAVFTSVLHHEGETYINPTAGELDRYQIMSPEEAAAWYRENGAQAKATLERQEDGRLILASLELLKPYDEIPYAPETFTALRLAALEKEYPKPKWVFDEEEFREWFPTAAYYLNDTALELAQTLFNAKLGTMVADINWSDRAAFDRIENLDNDLLLDCCLWDAEVFCWEGGPFPCDDPRHMEGCEIFGKYTSEAWGYLREDLERYAVTYFGEDAKLEHHSLRGTCYEEHTGTYYRRPFGGFTVPEPFVIAYAEGYDGSYEVIFTSMIPAWGESGFYENPCDYSTGDRYITMPIDEAIAWYKEHGALAKAVLQRQEDGRLIMESLEILRGYDRLEDLPQEQG